MIKTNLWVLGAINPFQKTNTFATNTYQDILSLVITAFVIGITVLSLAIWKGDEENVHKFKKGLFWTVAGFVVAVIGKGILKWVQSGVQ